MLLRHGILVILPLALVACERGVAAGPPASEVAGIYTMTTVSGRGPVTGSFTLTPSGDAVRRVRYRQSDGALSAEHVARGSFLVRADGSVDLRLREDDGRSRYEWRPLARLNAGVFVMRHPDPADGPDIIETYERR
ncbi:MAG: hypothetical protein M3125_05490 [Gemmatimonadota bacterium]|nr:hypothetical protein [Gemmatimonadota bacterium]